MIYLDNSTAQKPRRTAVQAMIPYFDEFFGSPLQPHRMGQELFPALELSYKAIYALVGAKESDTFVFTSSGQEAISQVIHSVFVEIVKKTGKNHFVASSVGEAAPILAISKLEEEGCHLTMCPLGDNGFIDVNAIADSLTPRTALVSLSSASALTGVVQAFSEISELLHKRGILLHVDVTHSLGKQAFDFDTLGADFITFNGEQIGSPKGTGGLFSRRAAVVPLISGEDEAVRLRGGSVNMPLLAAVAQSAREAKEGEMFYCTEVARLRDQFEVEVIQKVPEARVLFSESERLPHISCISFPGVRNELLLFALSRKQLYAGMGGGMFQQIELVLEASNVAKTFSQCALSFSLSHETTEEELSRASTLIQEAYLRLKRLTKQLGGFHDL